MATGTSPSAAEEALGTTNKTENFQRLTWLLMRGGLALLRDVFDDIHPPLKLPAVLISVRKQLKDLKTTDGNKVFSKTELKCLYNPHGPRTYGKSAEFDISLLYKLLRSICKLTEPATGWDGLPKSTDHSLEADVVRIRFYRNKIYGHNHSMKVPNADFENLWLEIREALLRIAGHFSNANRDEWEESIQNFFHDPLTEDAKEYVEELRYWYLMDMDTKDELEKIDKKVEQLEIKQDQRFLEILFALKDLQKNRSPSSAPEVEDAQLPSESVETLKPKLLEKPPDEEIAVLSTGTQLQANQQSNQEFPSFWDVVYSFKRPLNLLFKYFKNKIGVFVQGYRPGSLIVTVSCSSLGVLEALWEEYQTGHLNRVAQAALVTTEVLEKLNLREVKLRTIISEADYLSYKEFLKHSSGNGKILDND